MDYFFFFLFGFLFFFFFLLFLNILFFSWVSPLSPPQHIARHPPKVRGHQWQNQHSQGARRSKDHNYQVIIETPWWAGAERGGHSGATQWNPLTPALPAGPRAYASPTMVKGRQEAHSPPREQLNSLYTLSCFLLCQLRY